MMDFVSDKRFLVGLAVGWFVVPMVARKLSEMTMAKRQAQAA